MPVIYTGHSFYKVLAALCVLLVLLFAWQLRGGWDWGTLLFMVIAAWSAFRCARLMLSRVELATDRLRLHTAWSSPREVEFRQLSGVFAEGRGLKAHPACDPAQAPPPSSASEARAKATVQYVYVDDKGKHYHRETCTKLQKAGRKKVTLDDAGRTYWPCPVCKPPIRQRKGK